MFASALDSGGIPAKVLTWVGDEVFGADKVLRRALDDCSHYLGAGHPMTGIAGDNLRAATE